MRKARTLFLFVIYLSGAFILLCACDKEEQQDNNYGYKRGGRFARRGRGGNQARVVQTTDRFGALRQEGEAVVKIGEVTTTKSPTAYGVVAGPSIPRDGLSDTQGLVQTDPERVAKAFVEFYINLLGRSTDDREKMCVELAQQGPVILEEQ
ncbi:hypothetical protein K7X08_015486 [Anisodus acutangulus]|uniref:Uncharacterized protein n=1 Tax=Anisodus acutangulus TaxID=402998 RepID=A0A9Q1L475_9SOLA|nr:hypothetical protein K7X08_015486 [Anisodus acutangulus]